MKRAGWLLSVLVSLLVVPDQGRVEAAEIEKAPDGCIHAHAILGWSDFKKGPDESDGDFEERKKRPWVKMGWIVGRLNWGREKGKERLRMDGEYEPGVIQSASFRQYRVEGHDNALAYVVSCGYGGTCNMLAARLHDNYKGIGVPRVYCGRDALPKMLSNPTTPNIPIPTDEELAETGDEDDDDDLDDEDFGDDDDDDDKKGKGEKKEAKGKDGDKGKSDKDSEKKDKDEKKEKKKKKKDEPSEDDF